MTVLTQNDYVKLTLSDGKELVLTTPGWAFDGLDIPRTIPVTETTGRSGKRRYDSTGVHDYTFPFSVKDIDNETDLLNDDVGNPIIWERGLDGNKSGKRKDSGTIIIESVENGNDGGILMLTIAAQGSGDWSSGVYS